MPSYTHPINREIHRKRREAAFERWMWKALAVMAAVSFIAGGWPW